jgi:CRISPR-associated protein Csd1
VPRAALARSLGRARLAFLANESPRAAGLALIKAYHTRTNPWGYPAVQPYLNENHPDVAYHAGRMLAVLARLQYAALGEVGAGVVQRYYIAASQTPALVLGRLIGNAKNHLNKLEGGLSFWFENRIAEIVSRCGDRLPRTLDLEGQSLFALGYYQQLAHDRGNRATPKEETTNA